MKKILLVLITISTQILALTNAVIDNKLPVNAEIHITYPGCKSDTFIAEKNKRTMVPKTTRGACLISTITVTIGDKSITKEYYAFLKLGTDNWEFILSGTPNDFDLTTNQ